MTSDLYGKTLKRIERRLARSPRLVTINALLFTLFSVIAGFLSAATRSYGIMDGVIYWTIFFWSIVLFGHVWFMYSRSGARRQIREQYIQEEVLDIDDSYQLNEEELIDLHLKLSHDIQAQSRPFNQLMISGVGNLLLWPGMLLLMLFVVRGVSDSVTVFRDAVLFSLLGTLLLGFTMPVRQLFERQVASEDVQSTYDRLRAVYGYKRKRRSPPDTANRLAVIGDDGELVLVPENQHSKPQQENLGKAKPAK